MNEQLLFERFISQLSHWSKTGNIPKLGDCDIRKYLELQNQRIEEKGLKRTYDYTIDGKIYKVGDSIVGQIVNGYNKRLNYSLGTKKVTYERNGRIIYKEKKEVPFYQLLKWPEEDRGDWKKDTYVCDNCGNVETIEKLEETGCPYCGTHFTVSEMYPKVTNFYTLDTVVDTKMTFGRFCKIALANLLFALFITLCAFLGETGVAGEYSFTTFYAVAYLVCLPLSMMLSPLVSGMVESIPVSLGVAGAKAKITSKLKKYDPSFSYDYFEGKALSLLRMIIFAKDATQSVQYRGGALKSAYADIIDMDYRGGLDVSKIEENGNYIEVTLRVLMKNTYYSKKRCKKKKDTMYLRMRHDTTWKVLPDFSIVKVMCHGCGGSFDATKHRNCPYCQAEYNAGRDDWEVLEVL